MQLPFGLICSRCDRSSWHDVNGVLQLAELQKDVVTYSRGRGRQSQLQQHTYDAASSASDEEAGGCSQISRLPLVLVLTDTPWSKDSSDSW